MALPRLPANTSLFPTVEEARLRRATKLLEGQIWGSESVQLSGDGAGLTLTMLDRYGRRHVATGRGSPDAITLVTPPSGESIGLVGRPLGFIHDSAGRLVVCDSVAGLLRWDPSTRVTEILTNSADGAPVNYVNAVVEARDGTLYFTSSSSLPPALNAAGFYDTMRGAMLNLISGDAAGRVLRWDPESRQTSVVLDGLWYANGVALSPDESSLLVVETYGARVVRLWLRGPRAGERETLIGSLPGYPDGISRREGGGYWVALVIPPSPLAVAMPYRGVRALLAHLLPLLKPPLVKRWGCVASVGEGGEPLALLMDRTGEHVASVSAVEQHGRRLYLGNLMGSHVSYLDLEPGE